ncbi:flavodoxin [Ruminococcus sp.]|uniref:flavodoxin n=1 Tax=Ruminococcus sp. TaxID=41978 RepID=UPI0025E54E58|nr:flavodoxin [Ruminococcus sp.]MBQ8967266.1 flavodoxin [Ruminococcus sp.]
MKKMMTIAVLAALLLAGCGSSAGDGGTRPAQTARSVGGAKSEGTVSSEESSEAAINEADEEDPSKTADVTAAEESAPAEESAASGILVAYFTPAENGENDAITSASRVSFSGEDMGNAEAMANVVAAYTGGDLFSIQTVKDYPLEYNALADEAKAEQDAGELPELATAVDISGYDTVFVVYPIWWYTMPQPIYSFFDKYDFSDKTIIPVTTHEGSGLADSVSSISALEPGAAVLDGFSVKGADVGGSSEDIEEWLNGLGYQGGIR